jgi:hypothetical protein
MQPQVSTVSHPDVDLILERLPDGSLAWLKPEPERTYRRPARFRLTDQGRRALAVEACFGPWPTVAEAGRSC